MVNFLDKQKLIAVSFLFTLVAASSGCAQTSETDKKLGPWLNLSEGGIAVGPTHTMKVSNPDGSQSVRTGSLINGTLLPEHGDSFVRVNSAETSWGTGMMISLLTHASAEFAKSAVPGNILYIGSIAQQFGGPYGPHSSHQNGLDADVLFVGQKTFTSVLDEQGQVTSRFQTENNWKLWRMLVSQQILQSGQPTTAVSMILVAPEIKKYLCGWAHQNHVLDNPLDAEVMRRLRPTVGHQDHFHVRLKCSPYYPNCYQENDIAPGTGCSE